MPAVVSRPLEFRAVTEFLRSASQQPSGLVIEGEPGIGKTTLWLSALEEARGRGYQVFSARVGQAESVLAYAAVADLLRDIDDSVLAELSDVQRVAVDRVLLRASSEDHTTDQHVVAAAFAAVFDRLATDSPVLIAIDDLQWLDRSSKDVLAFAARRFKGGIGLLVTERSDAEGGSSVTWLHLSRPDRIERVRIGPLSIGGLHMLISSRLGRSLPRPTMVRIAETSGGNPFFALELARAIDIESSQVKSKLPSSLSELMRLRIGQLDRDARKLLLAAASVADPTVELLAQVTGAPVESLGDAEAKGIIGIEGNQVRFAHPLLAQSVYTDATAAERRAMHRSLAQTVRVPELRARHMALAASSADPETLNALDIAAEAAAARGAPAAAAELAELAIHLGGDHPERLIHAAQHHFNAGDPQRARALLEETVHRLPSGPLRGSALNLLAGVHLYDDNWTEAVAVLERALDDAEDSPALLVQTLIVLAFGQRMISKFDDSLASAQKAVTNAEQLGDPALISRALAMSVQLNFMYGNGVDELSLRRAVDLEDPDIDGHTAFSASMVEGLVLAWTGRLDEAGARMQALHRRCTERGAENDFTAVASCAALVEIWRGNFAEAARRADEANERAEQGGGSLAIALSMRSMVAAYLGREDDSRVRRPGRPGYRGQNGVAASRGVAGHDVGISRGLDRQPRRGARSNAADAAHVRVDPRHGDHDCDVHPGRRRGHDRAGPRRRGRAVDRGPGTQRPPPRSTMDAGHRSPLPKHAVGRQGRCGGGGPQGAGGDGRTRAAADAVRTGPHPTVGGPAAASSTPERAFPRHSARGAAGLRRRWAHSCGLAAPDPNSPAPRSSPPAISRSPRPNGEWPNWRRRA